jgi:hypothetical protein
MTTGQTLLSMGALVLLTTIMLNFYRIFGANWDTIDSSQLGIDATTIATSYFEIAHGLAFDHAVLDTSVIVTSASDLTPVGSLGRESGKNSPADFTDFDDFHEYTDIITVTGFGTYNATFDVYYVDPSDVTVPAGNRTYAKRMDLRVWRVDPPPLPGAGIDTVRMWTVMAYFSFQ